MQSPPVPTPPTRAGCGLQDLMALCLHGSRGRRTALQDTSAQGITWTHGLRLLLPAGVAADMLRWQRRLEQQQRQLAAAVGMRFLIATIGVTMKKRSLAHHCRDRLSLMLTHWWPLVPTGCYILVCCGLFVMDVVTEAGCGGAR